MKEGGGGEFACVVKGAVHSLLARSGRYAPNRPPRARRSSGSSASLRRSSSRFCLARKTKAMTIEEKDEWLDYRDAANRQPQPSRIPGRKKRQDSNVVSIFPPTAGFSPHASDAAD